MLVHGRSLGHRDDGFRGWRAVTQSTVWSDGVVMSPPLFDDDLSLFEGIEGLPIQKFVPEAGIEGLAVAVLPGTARLDVSSTALIQSLAAWATNSGSLSDLM